MNRLTTSGLILSRTNFGEADRILTVLTPDHGKLRLMAKGVRRARAKLAGSVELFSVSDLTYIRGRGDIGTLVSARLKSHYKNIIKDINRVNAGYEMLKLIDKNTEDEIETGYFDLLSGSLAALDDLELSLPLVELYFKANLLKIAGHSPNLETDASGQPLSADKTYAYDPSNASFVGKGEYSADHIKFLRLIFAGNPINVLAKVTMAEALTGDCLPLVRASLRMFLRS